MRASPTKPHRTNISNARGQGISDLFEEVNMTIRKIAGWVVFSGLMAFLLVKAPNVAGGACYLMGTRFYAAGNYKAAAGAFSGAVRIDPQFARAYVELGSSYLALKKYAQAEAAFLK